MDVMETFALIQKAYIAGIRNAPAVETFELERLLRRCAFCRGSDFVVKIEVDQDSENDYSIETLICEDCGMPLEMAE